MKLDELNRQHTKFINDWKNKLETCSYEELLHELTVTGRCNVIFRVPEVTDLFWILLREKHDEYKNIV